MKVVPRQVLLLAAIVCLAVLAGHEITSNTGRDNLVAWGTYLTGVGTVGLALAAFFTGVQAVQEFRKRTETERRRITSEHVRWVATLFRQFFQKRRYHSIRQKIDYDDLGEVVALMQRDPTRDTEFSQEDRDLLDQFTDYLNFFEMIAYLLKTEQLDSDDIRQMFDYYLRRMTQIKHANELAEYVQKSGFENLNNLLVEYGSGSEAQPQTSHD